MIQRFFSQGSTLTFLLLYTLNAWSASAMVMSGAQSQWLCNAYDDQNKQWMASNTYKQVAINKAYDACKKESRDPESCKAANEYCEALIKGKAVHPQWRCSALDHQSNVWVGDVYTNRHDAAAGAHEYCVARTSTPDSCYVNLLTCNYLNEF